MPPSDNPSPRRIATVPLTFTILSVLLYAASLTQSAFLLEDSQHNRAWTTSLLPLLIGWLGVIEAYFGWFANPLLLVAWILLLIPRARHAALICSLPALLLSLTTLIQRPDIWGDNDKAVIIQFGAGCWLWLASIAAATIASIVTLFPRPRPAPVAPSPETAA